MYVGENDKQALSLFLRGQVESGAAKAEADG